MDVQQQVYSKTPKTQRLLLRLVKGISCQLKKKRSGFYYSQMYEYQTLTTDTFQTHTIKNDDSKKKGINANTQTRL